MKGIILTILLVVATEDRSLKEIKKVISTEHLELRTTEVTKKFQEINPRNINLRPIDIIST